MTAEAIDRPRVGARWAPSVNVSPIFRKSSKSKSAQAKYAPLTQAEEDWVNKNIADAPELVDHLMGLELNGEELTVQHLDVAWDGWLQIGEENPQAVNPVINILGLAFGDILVRELGMEWVIANDGDGREIAVVGQPGDLLIYPTSVVSRRWEVRANGFFTPLFEVGAEQLSDARSTD